MAEKVINSRSVLLSKFVANRQVSASKTATSHIRKPLAAIFSRHNLTFEYGKTNHINPQSPCSCRETKI